MPSSTAPVPSSTASIPREEADGVSPAPGAGVRLAVAQTRSLHDPTDAEGIRDRGAQIRDLMRQASEAGARLLHLPEAALCFPSKVLLSSVPGEVAEADWTRFAWSAHEAEVVAIREQARLLGLWCVLGAPVRPGSGSDLAPRPFLSTLVIGPDGAIRARYDERLLSRTKQTYLYAAGTDAVTFEIDGLTFGCLSGLEGLFGDLVGDYEAAGVDCVLYGTTGPGDPGAERSLADSSAVAARQHGLWVSYAVHGDTAPQAPAGLLGPDGEWVARCRAENTAQIAVAEIGARPEGAPREWYRSMRQAHRARATR